MYNWIKLWNTWKKKKKKTTRGKLNSAAAAKSLQSCPTLCDPIDSSPPGSPVPGIVPARTLEWVAISFSNAWKWKVKVKSLSHVWLLATPWTAAYQPPPSMGFSRQEDWSGVLSIRETQIKPTTGKSSRTGQNCHYQKLQTLSVGELVEIKEPSAVLVGMCTCPGIMENGMECSLKTRERAIARSCGPATGAYTWRKP